MSERLRLPREWMQKSATPVWKAAAMAGWAVALLLGQCLVLVLAWAGPRTPQAPPPIAEAPPPPLVPRPPNDLQVSRSLARVRCLLAVGRSQEALSETIRCLTLCQRLKIDPPEELAGLFAETAAPAPPPPAPPSRRPVYRMAPPAPPRPSSVTGRVPGPAYPRALPPAIPQLRLARNTPTVEEPVLPPQLPTHDPYPTEDPFEPPPGPPLGPPPPPGY